MMWALATLVILPFFWMMGDLLWKGIGHLSWEFIVSSPLDAGRAGGIGPIVLSTVLIVGICLLVAFPLSIGTALFLLELSRKSIPGSQIIRQSLDVLAGVPSIVFGLFGYAVFCQVLGLGFSIASGGLTLACMVLPILTRTVEESFRAIPHAQHLSAAALGLSWPTTIRSVLIPLAAPGLLVGGILGIGRAMAETAALIFTSGYVDRMPESLLDSGRALSVHIYDLAMNVAGGNPHAYATALLLVSLLIIINLSASRLADTCLRFHQRPV